MDDLKRTVRDVEDQTRETGRAIDGHDAGDDVGNLGDDLRRGAGNLGDDLRHGAGDVGDDLRGDKSHERDLEERTASDPLRTS